MADRDTVISLPINSPVDQVLDRLDRVRRSGRGWTARCPAHADRFPSLSVAEGDDGRALLRCFAGCSVDEVTRALGLELRDLFPARDDRLPSTWVVSRPRPYPLPREIAARAYGDAPFDFTWAFAKVLARIPARDAEIAVWRSWRAVADSGIDVRLVLETAAMIRGVAVLRFGRGQEFTPRWTEGGYVESDGLARCVDRLLRRIEEVSADGQRRGPRAA